MQQSQIRKEEKKGKGGKEKGKGGKCHVCKKYGHIASNSGGTFERSRFSADFGTLKQGPASVLFSRFCDRIILRQQLCNLLLQSSTGHHPSAGSWYRTLACACIIYIRPPFYGFEASDARSLIVMVSEACRGLLWFRGHPRPPEASFLWFRGHRGLPRPC